MLEFNLKSNEAGIKYLDQIKAVCKDTGTPLALEYYSTFIAVSISKSHGLEAFIKEAHYLENDYELIIYHFDNKTIEIRIPINAIDIIYRI